ncbi:hypothetical protein QQS21_010603, partial [Conoideocrella luteorostrata]
KWHSPEQSPGQPTLHRFAVKKRKADDFHDELVARFDETRFQGLLVQWIADENLSFRLSDHGGLRKILVPEPLGSRDLSPSHTLDYPNKARQ